MTASQKIARVRNFSKYRLLGIRSSLSSLQQELLNIGMYQNVSALPSHHYDSYKDLAVALISLDSVLKEWDLVNKELGLKKSKPTTPIEPKG